MPNKVAKIQVLQGQFDAEYVHADDILKWWERVQQAIWKAAVEECVPESVRPFINNFKARLKNIPLPTPSERQRHS